MLRQFTMKEDMEVLVMSAFLALSLHTGLKSSGSRLISVEAEVLDLTLRAKA